MTAVSGCKAKILETEPLETESLDKSSTEKPDTLRNFGGLISAAKAHIVAAIDAELLPLELTTAQYRVVLILSKSGESTLASLCDAMDYDRGAMSRLLCRLEGKGLLEKKPCHQDRRLVYVSLSEKGRAFLPSISAKVNKVFDGALQGFSSHEKEQLSSLLMRFLNNLK